jgi:proline iminopeptidase
MYWEICGAASGVPVVFVHGGPGSGCTPNHRDLFDDRYQAILFDQRGCGRSLPNARDPTVSLQHNTTAQLIDDMETLRSHLDIDQWMLVGQSWGSTLALAYALAHRDRVSAVVLSAVTTTRHAEIDWLYRGLGSVFPAEHRAFCEHAQTSADGPVWAVLDAYTALLVDRDAEIRAEAARAWHQWEDATISLEPAGAAAYSSRPLGEMLTRARICAHYFGHRAFLADNHILDRAHELDGIPATLIHGRLDISSPPNTAWHLANAWPNAKLQLIDNAGHIDPGHMRSAIQHAIAGHAHHIADTRFSGLATDPGNRRA